jgi:hypothetical protein
MMQRRELIGLLAVAVPSLAGLSAEQLAVLEQGASTRRRLQGVPFDPQQFKTADQLSEIIIPATETPGAHAAGVAAFMERVVADWYHEDERVAFLAGLTDVNTRSKRLFGEPFTDGSSGQQGAVVEQLEDEARNFPGTVAATFWGRFRALTIYGYYTSQPGVVDELETPFMPGYYDGDVPVGGARSGRH